MGSIIDSIDVLQTKCSKNGGKSEKEKATNEKVFQRDKLRWKKRNKQRFSLNVYKVV